MDYADVQQRTQAHLGVALSAALECPVVCITHAPNENGRLGVTGRVFAGMDPFGVRDVTLLDAATVTHRRGYVVSKEPKLFQEAIAKALSHSGEMLAQAVEEGRVVLCGWFAQAVWKRTDVLADYLNEGLISTVPHPDRWIQDPESVHAVLTQALDGSGFERPTEFPSLAAFSQLLRESKAAGISEAWHDKSPEERAEIGARRSKFWKELPPERWEAIKEKKRLRWLEKSSEEREAHGREIRDRWAALSAEEKKARGDAISSRWKARSAEAKALTKLARSTARLAMPPEAKERMEAKRLSTMAAWSDEKKAKVGKKHAEAAKTLNLAANCQRWRKNASPAELAAAAGKGVPSQLNTKALAAEEAAKETRRALDEGTVFTVDKMKLIVRSYRKRDLQREAGNLTAPTPVADELARQLQPDSARSRQGLRCGAARTAGVAERAAPAVLAAMESVTTPQARKLIVGYETRMRQRAQGWDIPPTPLSDELATTLQLRF